MPPGCWPRSATPATGSRPLPASPVWPGVTPSTRQSGQVRIAAFRWAVNKDPRGAVCDFAADSAADFAADSVKTNPWAADLYQQARNRGRRHPHAVRILARACLGVICKCWTTSTAYDPGRHNALLNHDRKKTA